MKTINITRRHLLELLITNPGWEKDPSFVKHAQQLNFGLDPSGVYIGVTPEGNTVIVKR